jgi:hypothetical protein
MSIKQKKILGYSLFILSIAFLAYYLLHPDFSYSKNDYTFETDHFYIESTILVNRLDDQTKSKHFKMNKNDISMQYVFKIVPKNRWIRFYDFKVDAIINEEINALHLVPIDNVFRSYVDDDGVDFGYKMGTFALHTGRGNWINEETYALFKDNYDVLEKDIIFEITWTKGYEKVLFPKEYVKIIID